METIINYVTMTTDITLRRILNELKRFIDDENYKRIIDMSIIPGMMELIKVLQEKYPDNCLQILVDVLVESGFLKDTGWKEKPDPISALLLERRESIKVIERLMEAVKRGDVNNVNYMLSQYPKSQHIQHIRIRCCCLALERRDLSLAQFLYQYDRHIVDTEKTRELIAAAIHSDFTEGFQYLVSQGLPLEVKESGNETPWSALMVSVKYNSLNVTSYILSNHVRLNLDLYKNVRPLEEANSIDMLRLLLANETIKQNVNYKTLYSTTPVYHQILKSSTQSDCMSRVQILIDAGVRVKDMFALTQDNMMFLSGQRAWFKIIKEKWLQVFDYLLDQLKDKNFTNEYRQNILHIILSYNIDYDVEVYDLKDNILDFVIKLTDRGIDIHIEDIRGEPPLILSCRAGYCDVVKYLHERGADVNQVNNDGETALMMARKGGHNEIVKYLIQHGGVDDNKKISDKDMSEEEEMEGVDGGPPRQHKQMETIINYVTMTTHITLRHILDELRWFIDDRRDLWFIYGENYKRIIDMSIIPGMMELIKILQEKYPDNCLQILVGGLVKSQFLKDTGWKEKPDPISALLLERRESIEVIEKLMEAVKEGDVNNVKQLLSQYPIPRHIQHIRRRCCCLALERRDLSLAQFLYQYDRHVVDTEKTRELFTAAIHSDFTEGVQYLVSQGLPLEVKGYRNETSWRALMVSVRYNSLNVTKYILSNHVRLKLHSYITSLEEAKSIDMMRLLLTNKTIRKKVKNYGRTFLYNQILLSSTQSDCMSRVQILIDAGATVKEMVTWSMNKAWLIMIGKRWFQVIDYLLDHVKNINFTYRHLRNILHFIFFKSDMDMTDYDVTDYDVTDHDVKNNILDFVKNLVERGVNIHAKDKNGASPLLYASKAGYLDVIKYLIERGADVNIADKDGWTALMMACRKGHKETVKYLIQHEGADVDMVGNDGHTALMLACCYGHKEIQHGSADVNMVNKYGWTALMMACRGGHKETVKYLMQHGGADVSMVDKDGWTALMKACRGGHKEIVECLIQHGSAGVNMVDKYGFTALYFCLSNIKKYITVFKLLVESGGDLSLPSNGVKLFEKILDNKVYDLFLYVISLKPQIVDVTKKGDNILHLLAKVNYDFTMEHFSWLFDCSVDINHRNDLTNTPLMIAAVLLNEKYLEVFTCHPDVDLNKQNNNGHTALHCLILGFTELVQGLRQRQAEDIAQSNCKMSYPTYMRCVDILLGAGTDVNIQDNEGKTVLMMAARENDKQLVRKLLGAGAMVDKVDSSGRPTLLYVNISDSVYDPAIFLLLLPCGGNHLLDLPCIHGNTFIQTVLQFPRKWQPCKVVSFVRWLVYRNCSLQHLRGENGHSSYNDVSLDEFSILERQNLRRLLYLSGAPKEEIIATVNFQAEDEAEDATEILHSKNRETFEKFCLNVSLRSKCIRYFRQLLRTEIRAKLPGLEIPHLKSLLLLEDVVGDKDDVILGEFEEREDESDFCSYIVDKNYREYYGYLNNETKDMEGRYGYYTLEKCTDDDDDDDS